jgi:hypothetical protein
MTRRHPTEPRPARAWEPAYLATHLDVDEALLKRLHQNLLESVGG